MTDDLLPTEVHNEHLFSTALPCQVHGNHAPHSHVNHRHHVWPRGMGGPDVAENIIVICPTGHYNTHQLLDSYIKTNGSPDPDTTKSFSRGERKYAKLGYDRYMRKAL